MTDLWTEDNLARWNDMSVNGGGGMTWEQICEAEGLPCSPNALRKRVVRWRKERAAGMEAPPVQGVPSAMPNVEVLDPHTLPDDYWERLWENAKEQSRLRRQLNKPQTVFNVKVNDDLPIMLVWTGDWHLLDAGTDHDRFDADLALWKETPGVYLGIGGDLSNWTSPAVLPRAMPANVLPSELAAVLVRRKVEEIKAKVLFGVVGNHDAFPGATGWHPVDDIYRDCGIPNLGPGGRVFLKVGEVTYQIEARHSFNYNSSLNDTNSHRRLWEQSGKPDMVFTAHLHNPTLHHRSFDGTDTVWARNGTYKRDDSYAKSKNFVHTQPEPPDQPGVILFPDERRMIPFRDYHDGLPLLATLRERYGKTQTA